MDVSVSIGYYIGPTASATLCDKSPIGDATACFHVNTKPGGSIYIYAYYRFWECDWCWYGPCDCDVS